MSDYEYHLVAVPKILCEPIFRNVFKEQEPKIWFEMEGDLKRHKIFDGTFIFHIKKMEDKTV